MAKQKIKWMMPPEIEPYREYICNTGGNSIEDLMNRDPRDANVVVNAPLALMCQAVESQIVLLRRRSPCPRRPVPAHLTR